MAFGARDDYRPGMKISDVTRRRGTTTVITVTGDASVAELLRTLAEHQIGAVVVSDDGARVEGIVSERDVVRSLHRDGGDVLAQPVHTIMTSEVYTCEPSASLEEIAQLMTERRIRHVPVLKGGSLATIVSLGDVVKARLSQLESERDQLIGYISQ